MIINVLSRLFYETQCISVTFNLLATSLLDKPSASCVPRRITTTAIAGMQCNCNSTTQQTRWLYCVDCPQYSIWLKVQCYLCDCLSGRVQRWQVVKVIWHKEHRHHRRMVQRNSTGDGNVSPMRAIGATWQIQLNLCILQPTRVHNPNDKSIG